MEAVGRSLARDGRGIAKGVGEGLPSNRNAWIVQTAPLLEKEAMKLDQIKVGFRYRKDLGDLRVLTESIAEVGLLHPVVVTPEGRLIAGQRRLEACRRLGWKDVPVTVVDLLQAARGEAHENLIRKDLLPSEIVALKRAIEPLERREARERQGARDARAIEDRGDARDKIARYLGVGRTTVDRAEAVVEAAEDDPDEYSHLVEQMDRTGNVASAFRRLNVERQAADLEREPPPLPEGPFRVIVADPPWQYETGGNLPYPTMSVDEIKSMRIAELAEKDAILWLWTTNAHLRVAFEVVDAWGFEYKSLLTWVKDRMGTGDWLRGQTEHCLLAIRGEPVFLNGKRTTVLQAARREHSRKPEAFYTLVQETSPGSRVELFAREVRVGWSAFGAEPERFANGPSLLKTNL